MRSATAPFTDADALEDSALLAALDNGTGNVHALDGARLVEGGLVTADEPGHYHLTEDGYAVARALRAREAALIPDDTLKIILSCAGRATAKRTGWITGLTFAHRPYIEMVRLSDTSPEAFDGMVDKGSTWADIPFQIFSQLNHRYADHDGARIYFAFEPGTYDHDRFTAMEHAGAVWADLCGEEAGLRVGQEEAGGDRTVYLPPSALLFHHNGRDVRLTLTPSHRYHVEIISGPDTGRTWNGHRADAAVKAMARTLYGSPCPDGYGTGRDSCPGCDASAETFENQHPVRGAMPGSRPALTVST
ncbi:hypothetical protein PUR49_11375 [Streptomyces sp. BE147]|uniref:hypothetical protein n=1 Tax=Streptomyces sp. BE147 TaxID=3002524 RepID=UPI002E7A3539|nr:hypothetical protein [Streptomyces sp. BE147]MEE1737092.1 hypothetical protein [Streptomyces sp. BE147]